MAKNPPADADQAPAEQPPAAAGEASPERRYWRYSGPERLYAHIPVTVRDGDVIEYTADAIVAGALIIADPPMLAAAGVLAADVVADLVESRFGEVFGARTIAAPPAFDGHWEPCDGPATVRPDNHPQLVDEVTPDA